MSPTRSRGSRSSDSDSGERVRYAVIGLGHIAQVAVLPAFANARRNSELVALVSGDDDKLRKLGRKYRVPHAVSYDELGRLIEENLIDAAYVALPNDLHHEAVVQLANAGIHVLCEKPLGVTERECREMIDVARARNVLLMTAYRLHFDSATLAAVETVRSGKIGEARHFTSTFTMQVTDEDNIRLSAERGGGPLYDLGVYCINAARMLFESEPVEVMGMMASRDDPRFDEVPEMVTAVMRFPGERIASFTCGFGSADTSQYRIVGTKGDLVVEPAYEYAEGLAHRLTIDGKVTRKKYAKKDQFGPELIAFSDAILGGDSSFPTGEEGLADVRIIRAIAQSAIEGMALELPPMRPPPRPDRSQEMRLPAVRKPEEIKARSPSS